MGCCPAHERLEQAKLERKMREFDKLKPNNKKDPRLVPKLSDQA